MHMYNEGRPQFLWFLRVSADAQVHSPIYFFQLDIQTDRMYDEEHIPPAAQELPSLFTTNQVGQVNEAVQ